MDLLLDNRVSDNLKIARRCDSIADAVGRKDLLEFTWAQASIRVVVILVCGVRDERGRTAKPIGEVVKWAVWSWKSLLSSGAVETVAESVDVGDAQAAAAVGMNAANVGRERVGIEQILERSETGE